MKKLFIILCLAHALSAQAQRTEFYADISGHALNAGSDTNIAAKVTATSGAWVQATGVFTLAGMDLSTVNTNTDWASIYPDGSSIGQNAIGRVIAFDNTLDTVTVSLTAKWSMAFTANTTSVSCKIGGAIGGPTSGSSFPFGGYLSVNATNYANNVPRLNYRVGATAFGTGSGGIVCNLAGPLTHQGYTSVPGDGGLALFNLASGASYILLTVSAANIDLADMIFSPTTTFASGTSAGISVTGAECTFTRVVCHDVRNSGFNVSAAATLVECEAYNCNLANTAGQGGYQISASSTLLRCIAHDNTQANADGFNFSGAISGSLFNCIADTNGRNGLRVVNTLIANIIGCDFYNNSANGIDFVNASAAMATVINCNFFNNVTNGINSTTSATLNGTIVNCAFGTGTAANGVDIAAWITNGTAVRVVGTVNYAANLTPWTTPTTGNFTILSTAAGRAAGRGAFTQTQASYTGTVGYPDIGAAQSITNASSGGGTGSYTITGP